ncbi:unnamed protein product [Rotaria sp. Silwood1]|nr:unnamed protein product [Rotaria sp. Silwood1]CAF1142841.1 unnamed protein product [Rotaria sp. Silwood1]CAF1147741.1 unnamed protein product [Rotaria sp. Silwood1]CAF3344640.1 unnamed protein product [Rotaria sp. Silwood1]CAF3443609.1 unnamed protein product [Rotaria sp. Silwood1]
MERGEDDDIPTPSTSRSNSISEDEEKPSLPSSSLPAEETIQSESSPTKDDTSSNVADQIRTTVAAKQATFVSSSSSSESEPDFVDVTKNDFTQDGSASNNAVSFANWLMRSNDCFM